MKTMQFWFEFASTYSYLSAMQIESAAKAENVTLEWRAFLLGPVFKQQGLTDVPFRQFPIKGRYMWRDIERLCEDAGLPFQRPSVFPRNGLLAARVACHFATAPWLPSFVRAVYRANFAQDRDIADVSVLSDCLAQAGQSPEVILLAAQSAEAKQALMVQTEAALRREIFGAPSFIVGDELFWGQDRLAQALAYSKKLPG